jgi:hypothetical protein
VTRQNLLAQPFNLLAPPTLLIVMEILINVQIKCKH